MDLTANHNIQQIVEVCSDFEKRTKLIKHLDQISSENAKVLIFVGTKRIADDLTKYLRTDGWPALAIHGDKEQYVVGRRPWKRRLKFLSRRERDWVLGEFKAGRSPILIATDVASRGLGTYVQFLASAAARWSFHLSDKTIISGHVVFFAYHSRDQVRSGVFWETCYATKKAVRVHTCTHQIILRFPDFPRTEIALEAFTESDPMLTFWAHLFSVLALSSGTFWVKCAWSCYGTVVARVSRFLPGLGEDTATL